MGLTETERSAFVDALVWRGWILEKGTIWAPSRGLWFFESHFSVWALEEFRDIFSRRAKRIREVALGNWEQSARENQDASEAAEELLNQNQLGR
jgi:hypothetical protein